MVAPGWTGRALQGGARAAEEEEDGAVRGVRATAASSFQPVSEPGGGGPGWRGHCQENPSDGSGLAVAGRGRGLEVGGDTSSQVGPSARASGAKQLGPEGGGVKPEPASLGVPIRISGVGANQEGARVDWPGAGVKGHVGEGP